MIQQKTAITEILWLWVLSYRIELENFGLQWPHELIIPNTVCLNSFMDIITKSLSTTKVVDFNFKINILNKKK